MQYCDRTFCQSKEESRFTLHCFPRRMAVSFLIIHTLQNDEQNFGRFNKGRFCRNFAQCFVLFNYLIKSFLKSCFFSLLTFQGFQTVCRNNRIGHTRRRALVLQAKYAATARFTSTIKPKVDKPCSNKEAC